MRPSDAHHDRGEHSEALAASSTKGVNGVALAVFIFFFLAVTVMGFLAARWRKAEQSANLDEWGLGGRSFGTWVTWFLLGGDLYTAYTFVAVPAAIYAAGASGFFAVPYTILVYPLIFTFLPRLWSVSHKHGYVTTSDFVRGRFGSKGLSLAVALTGILATMPYIALQLVGIQAVLDVMGIGGGEHTNWFVKDLPLLIAFAVLAAYTYSSGLRAPALIAFVKDGADLSRHRRGDHLHPDQAGRLRRRSSTRPARRCPSPAPSPASRAASWSAARTPSGRTRPWRSARRWRSSCTRTRSPRRCPRAAAM